VKKYMKRIIKVLAVAALMAVLMVSSVSPAFAASDHNNDGTPGYSKWWQDSKTGTANETDGVNKDGAKGWKYGQVNTC
jgi:hypothetical protein